MCWFRSSKRMVRCDQFLGCSFGIYICFFILFRREKGEILYPNWFVKIRWKLQQLSLLRVKKRELNIEYAAPLVGAMHRHNEATRMYALSSSLQQPNEHVQGQERALLLQENVTVVIIMSVALCSWRYRFRQRSVQHHRLASSIQSAALSSQCWIENC